MNLKLTNTILLLLLTVVSITLSYVLLRPAKHKEAVFSHKAAVTDAENELKATFWNVYPTLIIPNDDVTISDTITLKGEDTKVHKLGDLVDGRNKLIFRYSSFDCEICVDSVITAITRLTKNTPVKDLIIITDTQSERDFIIRSKNKNHPYPVYYMPYSKLGLSIENHGIPFLFILTKTFKTSKIFTPFKEVGYQTNQYLQYALNYLKQ